MDVVAATSEEDLALLHRAQRGDYEAFQHLVERYQGRLYGLAWRIVGQKQDAEDVVQQTFLSLLEHLTELREESSLGGWLLRVATNHALKILRKKRGLPTLPLEAPADSQDRYDALPHPEFIAQWRDSPEELAQRAEVRQLLDQAMLEIDEKYRIVFVLRDIEELSVRETAQALGLTEGTVKVRLLRARLALRERLTQHLGDEATRMFPDHRHD